jgi:high-affinity K+ transport system ATPase subunit B
MLGQSLADLAPNRQLQQSGILPVVEIVLCATLLGTATACLLGPTVQVLGVTLSIDALLFAWQLVGSVVHNFLNSRKQPMTAVPAVAATRWAYRVVNYPSANGVTEPCEIAAPSPAGDCEFRDGLELEATKAADLRTGDLIIVEAGQTVLADGTILDVRPWLMNRL